MDQNQSLSIVILAAGKGTRMKSALAKVLHHVFMSPMVHHVLDAVAPLNAANTIVIVGHQREAVEKSLTQYRVETVTQQEQLGTGHAVRIAESSISENSDTVMILCGDTPLIRPETLQQMYTTHRDSGSVLTVMTTLLENPTNYGRILSDDGDRVIGIVEEKDATPEQKALHEINAGIYCADRTFLFEALKQVRNDNSQGEIYLTDIVSIAVKSGKYVEKYLTPYSHDVLGVNSRVELSEAHSELQRRRNREIMLQGITIEATESVSVSPFSTIGKDTLLLSGVHINGTSVVGESCILNPGVIITDCSLGDNVTIGAYSVLTGLIIPANTCLAPFSTTL